MKKIVLIIICLLHAGVGFASQKQAQTVDNTHLIDNDYAFKLVKPSSDWRLLTEEGIVKITPDAVAGIFNMRTKIFLAVIPELASDVQPKEFSRLIQENMPLDNKVLVSEEAVSLGGYPGYRLFTTGLVNQIPFSYVITVYKRGAFAFQTISWKMSSDLQKDEIALKGAQTAFRFSAGREPRARQQVGKANFNGIGWRVKDERYENVINGMRINLPDGWRFTGLEELKQMNSDASVGLVNGETGNFCIFIIERLGHIGIEKYKSIILDDFSANNAFESYDQKRLTAKGQAFTLHYFSKVSMGENVSFDYLITFFQKGDFVFQVLNWWMPSNRIKSAEELPELFSSISWLTDNEMPVLRDELIALTDVDRSVVGDECYRNSQYRNFDFNLSVKFPKGFWSHAIGFAAREQDEDAALIMGNLENDLNLILSLNREELSEGLDYHTSVLNEYGVPEDAETIIIPVNGLFVRSTRFHVTHQDLPFEYNLATVSNGNDHVQILFYRIAANGQNTQNLEMAVLKGIEMGKHLPGISNIQKNGNYVDHRLGYSVSLPDKNYQVKDITPKSMKKIGSLVSIVQRNPVAKVVNIKANYEYACGAFHTDSDIRSFVEQAMLNTPGFRKSGLKMTSEQNIKWHGYNYKEFKYKSTSGMLKSAATLRTASVGGTTYFYLAMSRKGLISEDPHFDSFRIID